MKQKTHKTQGVLTGMAALLLVFGLVLAGCPMDSDDGGGGGGGRPATGITINGEDTVAVVVEGKRTLTATVTPSDSTDTVVWSSGDTATASIDPASGEVTGVKAGTATITATAGSQTDTITVNVVADAVKATGITINGGETATVVVNVNGQRTLTATVTPANSTDPVVWTSGDTATASIDPASGVVTGVKAGTATITATAGDKTDTITVTVLPEVKTITVVTGAQVYTLTSSGTTEPYTGSRESITIGLEGEDDGEDDGEPTILGSFGSITGGKLTLALPATIDDAKLSPPPLEGLDDVLSGDLFTDPPLYLVNPASPMSGSVNIVYFNKDGSTTIEVEDDQPRTISWKKGWNYITMGEEGLDVTQSFPAGYVWVIVPDETGNNGGGNGGGETTPDVVTDRDLTGKVTAPVVGAAPVTTAINEAQYVGNIAWQTATGAPVSGPFAAGTQYKAVVSLTAKSGYTFNGVGSFTYSGTTYTFTAISGGNSGTVTITFPATAADTPVTDFDLTGKVTAPVVGADPVTTFTETEQYTGAIVWKQNYYTSPHTGPFVAGTVYKAEVTLTAKSGYTFNGVAANAFTYTGETTVTFAAIPGGNSGTVTITFPVVLTAFQNTLKNLEGGTTAEAPATVNPGAITIGPIDTEYSEWGKVNTAVKNNKKYVILDLSGCTFTGNEVKGSSAYVDAGMNIFRDNQYIKGIILPTSVTAIGNNAFDRCGYLTSVTIPAGVTSIGQAAFSDCTGLTSITIPAGVTSIGEAAFSDCTGLTSVTMPADVTSIGGGAFPGDLRNVYNKAGTYTRTAGGDTWTKQ